MTNTGKSLATTFFLAAMLSAFVCEGAASAEAALDAQLGEIIVTANKRSEKLFDVASSVSVVSGDDLARTQTLDLQDIARAVPGLSVSSSGLFTTVTLRGLSSQGDGATVATVVDDVPLSFSAANTGGALFASDFDTYDLARIEVLRGPQGTLYGAAAEGGLIKYVTTPPQLYGFNAGAEAGGSSIAHGNSGESAKGYLNVPIVDGKVALRVNGFYESLPGFVSNRFLGQEAINDGRRYGGRLSVLVEPTPELSLRGTAFLQYRDLNGTEMLRVNGDTNPQNPLGLIDGYDGSGYSNSPSQNRLQVFSFNAQYDFPAARLQSITSYGSVQQKFDGDAPSLAPVLTGIFGLPTASVTSVDTHRLRKFNQEIRLTSQSPVSLQGLGFDWQIAGFYTHEKVAFVQDLEGRTFPAGEALPPPFGDVASFSLPSSYSEYAGFGAVTLHFTPKLDLELGGRVAKNKQESQVTEGGLLFTGGPSTTLPSTSSSETVETYSVAIRYRINPAMMFYSRVASGYRPGGPQVPIIGQPANLPDHFQSDSTVNYEVGAKGYLFNQRLAIDVAAFRVDWKDMQITQQLDVVNPDTGVSTQYGVTGNAGRAQSRGLESSLNWNPYKGLNVGFIGSFTDAFLSQAPPVGSAGSKGDRLAYVPKFTSNFSVNYEWAFNNTANAFIGASWTYTSSRKSTLVVGGLQTNLPSYNDLSLLGGVHWGAYTVQLYGKNLSDERGISSYYGSGALGASTTSFITDGSIYIVRPRTVGIRVSADF